MSVGELLPVSGVVLAGGASRRMGRNKAFLELDGRPLLAVVIERLAEVCAEVLVVAGDVDLYAGFGVPVVGDRFPGVGALGGLHAGLDVASFELALVVGCDMPFLDPALLRAFAAWAEGYDVALLRQGEQVEPLHAAYRRTCLPAIEQAIRSGRRRTPGSTGGSTAARPKPTFSSDSRFARSSTSRSAPGIPG